MIYGAHAILYSTDADADRVFFRDVLKYHYADAGHGWLIFALPPAELALHPGEKNGVHEVYLMCDDVHAFLADMKARGVATTPVHEERWGSLTTITLPSGGKLGVYQPRHPSPIEPPRKGARRSAKSAKSAKRSARKGATSARAKRPTAGPAAKVGAKRKAGARKRP